MIAHAERLRDAFQAEAVRIQAELDEGVPGS
jgi:hypothetical protein